MEKGVQHWNGLPWELVEHLGGVQETTECDTQCWGLGDRIVLGQRLDTILEVFSTLGDFLWSISASGSAGALRTWFRASKSRTGPWWESGRFSCGFTVNSPISGGCESVRLPEQESRSLSAHTARVCDTDTNELCSHKLPLPHSSSVNQGLSSSGLMSSQQGGQNCSSRNVSAPKSWEELPRSA